MTAESEAIEEREHLWTSFLGECRKLRDFNWFIDRFHQIRGTSKFWPGKRFCPIHAVYLMSEGKLDLPTKAAGPDNPGIHAAAWAMGYERISSEIVDVVDERPNSTRGRQLRKALGMVA